MPKANLSNVFCANAGCEVGKTKTDWYDTTVTGFVLECRSTGGRTYYLRYQSAAGKQKQHKIGCYEDVTFAAAKKEAHRLRAKVVMGGDPGAEKARAKAIPLYRELSVMHLTDAKLHQRSYTTTEMYVRRHLIPKWGKVPVNEIDSRAVAQWLSDKQAEGLAPATVIKLKALLGRSYSLGARWGIPGTEKNPTHGVTRPPLNNARQRYISGEESARLRVACAQSQNSQLQFIVQLLLLTGARVGELLDAEWCHIDLENQSWLIPTSKSGKSRHVPLSQAALAIIESVPRFSNCPWFLPNPDTLSPFVSIKHSFARAIKVAKLPGLRIHDLRHSAASFMINNGVDLYSVSKVLGHANVSTTARYSHLQASTLIAAVEAGAAKQAAA